MIFLTFLRLQAIATKSIFLEKLKQIYSDGGWKVEFLFERNYTKYESFPNVSYYDTYTGFKFS